MGVPVFDFQDPFTRLIGEQLRESLPVLGEGIVKGFGASQKQGAIDRVLDQAKDEEGNIDPQRVSELASKDRQLGPDEAKKLVDILLQPQKFEMEKRKAAREDLKLKAETDKKEREDQIKTTARKNADLIIKNVIEGDISPERGLSMLQDNVQDSTIASQTGTTLRSFIKNKNDIQALKAEGAQKALTNTLQNRLTEATENSFQAQNTLNDLEVAKSIIPNISKKDVAVRLLKDNGIISDTTANQLLSSNAQNFETITKQLVSSQAKDVGGSNPNSLQTKIIQDAVINYGRDPVANEIMRQYLSIKPQLQIARAQILSQGISKLARGEDFDISEVDERIKELSESLLNQFEENAMALKNEKEQDQPLSRQEKIRRNLRRKN